MESLNATSNFSVLVTPNDHGMTNRASVYTFGARDLLLRRQDFFSMSFSHVVVSTPFFYAHSPHLSGSNEI